MSAAALTLHQLRYDQRIFWRNPAAVFFTVIFPVIFLFLFAGLFGNGEIEELGVDVATYYVPGIITLAVVSATLVSLTMNLVIGRETGRLKRFRGTPMPTWAFIAGRIGNSIVVSLLMVLLVTALGAIFFGVEVPTTTLPALLVTLIVGAISFSALGFALSAAIPSEDAAPAITNATVLPLYFISGVFIPESEIPDGVLRFADLFPIRHFFEAFFAAFDPTTTGVGLALGDLAVVAAWGAIGLALAARYFRWTPKRD
ncbi:MAG TPA: ABC transporter permease [Solirubrobacterales bacterium]|nr:ABC transporter permease [Solirubrobacterales bacterium]